MDHFVVSARKYRPSTFGTVVGQNSITTTLKNEIRNKHLAQAFLFCGPRGVGKTTCARILAKTINCSNLTSDIEGCNECESCVSFNNGQSLNIFELDAASNNSVEDIRSLVDQVRYPPQSGIFKIYIIDEVHMLSSQAFNAFLKTLEEPPHYAIFILATTEKHKIIPTILSRCQIFDFNRITIDDISKHLASIAGSEHVEAEPEALHTIALKADGALRDALSIFDQIVSFAGNKVTYKDVIENLNILDYEYYFRVTDQLVAGAYSESLILLNEIIEEGFDVHHFIAGLASHFRNLLVCKDPRTLILLLETSAHTREKYKAQSAQCTPGMLLSFLEIATRCDVEFKSAQNQRLLTELALLKMSALKTSALIEKATGELPASLSKKKPTEGIAGSLANSSIQVPPESKKGSSTPPRNTVVASPVITPEPVIDIPVTEIPVVAEPRKISPVQSGTISISRKLKSEQVPQNFTPLDSEKKMAAVTVGDVAESLRKFADSQLHAGKKQLAVALSKHPAKLLDSLVIEIPVDNPIQSDEIMTHKSELLSFLKSDLQNHGLDIQPVVIEDGAGREVAYTPAEKFKKMAEKNPELNQMRQQFGLELDF